MRVVILALIIAATAAGQATPSQPAGQQPAGQQPPAKPETKPEDKCAAEGTITDAVTGAALKKAHVMMSPLDSSGERDSFGATTDAEGKFAMKDLEPGRYSLVVERTGYARQNYGARKPGSPGTTLTLGAGQKMTALDVKLTPQGVITGRVVDADGEPVEHARVSLLRSHFRNGKKEVGPVSGAQTNDLGEYRLSSLTPGKYFLSAALTEQRSWGLVDRSAKPKQENGLAPTYYPSGTDVGSAAPVTVAAGASVRLGDLRMEPSPMVRVRGKITGANGGAQMLLLFPREAPSRGVFMPRTGRVKNDGTFEVPEVTPGLYFLQAQGQVEGKSRSAIAQIDVGREDVEGVIVAFGDALEISGTIKKEGDGDLSFDNLHIFVHQAGQAFFGNGQSDKIAADGTFHLTEVTGQRAEVTVYGEPDTAYVKSIRLGQQDVTDGEADLTSARGSALEIVISTKAAQLTGSVRDADGKPKSGATVVLIPKKRERTRMFKSGSTDQYGQYKIGGLAPGDYTLYAFEELELGAQREPDYLKPVEKYGKDVTVEEGAALTAQLDLIPAEKTPAVE